MSTRVNFFGLKTIKVVYIMLYFFHILLFIPHSLNYLFLNPSDRIFIQVLSYSIAIFLR